MRAALANSTKCLGDKSIDVTASTSQSAVPAGGRRLFLRSNDFYDYSPVTWNANQDNLRLQSKQLLLADDKRRRQSGNGDTVRKVEVEAEMIEFASLKRLASDAWNSNGPPPGSIRSLRHNETTMMPRLTQAPLSRKDNSSNSEAFLVEMTNTQQLQQQLNNDELFHGSDNEITNRQDATTKSATQDREQHYSTSMAAAAAAAAPSLSIQVKSSKNHVLISVDNSIIYESGASMTKDNVNDDINAANSVDGEHSFPAKKRRRLQRHEARFHSTDSSAWLKLTARGNRGDGKPGDNKGEHTPTNQNANRIQTSESSRGIHVLVLNQFDGSLMSARIFDTYSSQQDDELVLYLNNIQEGRLLVFAVKDEGSFKMARNSAARRLLSRLGSRHIHELAWRDMWAMVTRNQLAKWREANTHLGVVYSTPSSAVAEVPFAEAISRSPSFDTWAQPVYVEAHLQLEPSLGSSLAHFECFAREPRRRDFCRRVEGYGRICDCKHPSPIEFAPRSFANSQIGQVPVVVIASNRPYYLYRMLSTLLRAHGVNSSMIIVFIDGFYWEPAEVCKLFNLRYIQHAPTGEKSARISNHYKTSLALTFEHLFPNASHAIIFEEDLDVARDALVYFNATLAVLKRDQSLYCASAWNDQGYEHSSGAMESIYRIETMPGLGWMLSRELFVDELKAAWPSASQQHDWDMWIRTAAVRRGRECLIPDVSRTYHFGSTGTNINVYFQRQYFSKHAFSDNYIDDNAGQEVRVKFKDLDKLDSANYERQLEQVIKEESRFVVEEASRSQLANGLDSSTTTRERRRDFLCGLANRTLDEWFNEANQGDETLGEATENKPSLKATVRRGRKNASYSNNGGLLMRDDIIKTNVIFIKMIDTEDYGAWLRLAKCWRLWDLDARGQHKSTWRLTLAGGNAPTLVVGYPASPYARFKPPDLVPYEM